MKFLTHYAISRQRDKDGDGKLNFEEYFSALNDHIHGYDDENADISHIGNVTVAKDRFSKLDKDNDGYASGHLQFLSESHITFNLYSFDKNLFCRFISEHELEPVLDKLYLSERYYSRQQAIHAISEVWFIFFPHCFFLLFFEISDYQNIAPWST